MYMLCTSEKYISVRETSDLLHVHKLSTKTVFS